MSNEIKDEIPNTESAPEPKRSSVQDWRGTPITVGAKVITHSKNWNHGLGVIDAIHPTTVTVKLREHDYLHKEKVLLVTIPHSVTVLTKDMFDELG